MGTLFIVSTPIGNLSDITVRAIQTLFKVPVIASEDTRRTHQLLTSLKQLYASFVPIESTNPSILRYDDKTELSSTPVLIEYLQNNTDVALVTDAGTPLIADPGYRIIEACYKRGIPVISIPGASAVTAALSVSGLPLDHFYFLGYLPEKSSQRVQELKFISDTLCNGPMTVPTCVFYCAPHKIVQTLDDMKSVYGNIDIVIARELTKIYEEVFRGSLSEATNKFEHPKGEFVILFHLEKTVRRVL